MPPFQIKALISDIESKLDKNSASFYKISLQGCTNYFYAFSNSVSERTLTTLKESPEKLVNQLALITYEEIMNKENQGTFRKIKQIAII